MAGVVCLNQRIKSTLNPEEVYAALLDARRHSALTGLPCEIERKQVENLMLVRT
jgi:hypothetical protein